MNNEQLETLSTSELSNVAGGYVSDLRNTRGAFNTGAVLGGLYAGTKTAQGLERYVGPGLATIAGAGAGFGGAVIGGAVGGVVGFGADVHESVTRRPVR